MGRTIAAGVAVAALCSVQPKEASAQVPAQGFDITIDYDQDGIINSIDTEVLNPAAPDVDRDGILNYMDRTPYVADFVDADFDGIKNSLDREPYINNTARIVLRETASLDCNIQTDLDCDGIHNLQDRFDQIADIADADFDGLFNEQDPFPYVPYVRTDIAALLNDDPNYCDTAFDKDCDGIADAFDANDFVAEYPDVDGDGIANKYDHYAFRNFNVASGYLDAKIEPYSRFHFPVILNPAANVYTYSNTLDSFISTDFDGDRIADAHDPYIALYDYDNNGRSDSLDASADFRQRSGEVDYFLETLEEKRIEEGVVRNSQEQARIEEGWLAEAQEERRYEQARLEQRQEALSLEQRIAERRREEGVAADRIEQARREAQWRLEEEARMRIEDLRTGEDRFDVLHDDDSYFTELAERQVVEERSYQQQIIEAQQEEQLAAQRAQDDRIQSQRLDDKYQEEKRLAQQEIEDDYNSQDYDDDWYEWHEFENETYDYYNEPNYDWFKDY